MYKCLVASEDLVVAMLQQIMMHDLVLEGFIFNVETVTASTLMRVGVVLKKGSDLLDVAQGIRTFFLFCADKKNQFVFMTFNFLGIGGGGEL